jgi:hypothetical protein
LVRNFLALLDFPLLIEGESGTSFIISTLAFFKVASTGLDVTTLRLSSFTKGGFKVFEKDNEEYLRPLQEGDI